MTSNLEKYRSALGKLIARGELLGLALRYENDETNFTAIFKKRHGDKADGLLKALPSFSKDYQSWYSEALSVIKQLLPDRAADFIRYYEKPKSRKEIDFESYTIEDALHGLRATRGYEKVVVADFSAAIPRLSQQVSILRAASARLDSVLFDMRQLVQADVFDSEIDAARELLKRGFTRAAGAVAGVVLEKHLHQVCDNHLLKLGKSDVGISKLNDALKSAGVIETPLWRSIQHLGDLRNICDHNKEKDPTAEQVGDLIDGVDKLVKTLF